MTRKSTTKTSKSVVKNTKTDDEPEKAVVVKNTEKDEEASKKTSKEHATDIVDDSPHWYHYVALIIVLALAGVAVWRIFSIYDPSIFGAEHTARYFYGCTEKDGVGFTDDQIGFRNYGASVGSMFGPNGPTTNRDEAWIEIVELSNDYAIVSRHEGDGNWQSRSVDYNYELSLYRNGEVNECGEALLFTIY